jgi:hypothetical protein
MPNKYAITIGINTYANAPLQGCVNDAEDWRLALLDRGYEVMTLLNEEATKYNILGAIAEQVARLKYRDTLVVQYSGHGSWIPDKDNDEPDGRDEVWCAYDYEDGGLVLDDELHTQFQKRAYGSVVVLPSDSCFSGTVNRFLGPVGREILHDQEVIREAVRFLPPANFLDGQALAWARDAERMPVRGVSRSSAALLSGCGEDEFSYDAWIDNRYNGAFPKNLQAWHNKIRAHLPTQHWNQSPQINGTWWQKNRWMI